MSGLRALLHRFSLTFAGRCVRSFVSLQGVDRALVLGSQAFTALIPLLLLMSTLAHPGQGDLVSHALIRRFRLSGSAADSVGQLFAHSAGGATGLLSGLLLFLSGVSLTRRMQRMYQEAWRLDLPRGLGHALSAGIGLTVLVLGVGVLYLVRSLVEPLPFSGPLVLVVSALAGFLLWTTVPWLLLDRRIAWRRLIPSGVATAIGTSAYGIVSAVYMPRLLERYSEQYGLFGVTLALIGWLLAIAVIVVAATAVAAEFDRAPDPWARRIRVALRIEQDADGGARTAGPGVEVAAHPSRMRPADQP
jgi:membrane protein